jgi:hypothetical protein
VEIMSLPLDPPSQRIAELGGQTTWGADFDVWFVRTVNRDPTQRYSSAGLAVAELSDALGLGDPTLAVSQLNLARTNIASTRMQSEIQAALSSGAIPPPNARASGNQAPSAESSQQVRAQTVPGAGSGVGVFDRNATAFRAAMGSSTPVLSAGELSPESSATTSPGVARTSPIVWVAVGIALVSLVAVLFLAFGGNPSATEAQRSQGLVASAAPGATLSSSVTAQSTASAPVPGTSASASARDTARPTSTPGGGSTSGKPTSTAHPTATATAGGDNFGTR